MRRRLTPKTLAILTATAVAIAAGGGAYLLDAWPRLEQTTLDVRFGLQSPSTPSDVVVVAVDDKTFSDLRRQWPFPRRLHAEVIRRLSADGARAIAYDVQFSEPTDRTDDLALYEAISSSRSPVVLASTEVNAAGETNILGGPASLREAHTVAAAANLPADAGGVIRRYPYSLLGLHSLAVATAEAAGHHVPRAAFQGTSALIDFRGPPGTIRTVSFSDVLAGRVPADVFKGKVVVVGASAATLQDIHQTSTTTSNAMAGPEIQANAIWSALHNNPLREAPGWLAMLAIILAGAIVPLSSLRVRVSTGLLIGCALILGYLIIAQEAFDAGTVLSVSYPLAGWALGTIGMVAANYVGAFIERNAFARELHQSQLELIQRLTQAVDARDSETGEHIQRIGRLSQLLALEIGWTPTQAQIIKHASAMHDVGKIGIPDSILLKPGKLTPQEWETIKEHTTIGAQILSGSTNPLVQMACEIALAHHEHWDGTGYPNGLRGEQIPLSARICAIVDVYDALLSKRTYKEAWTTERTLAEMTSLSGTHFDPDILASFLQLTPDLESESDAAPTPERCSAAEAPLAGNEGAMPANSHG